MSIIACQTLIDITETRVTRGEGDLRDKQRNWETILQTLGLRTQPMILRAPRCYNDIELAEVCDFGEFYQGSHRVWDFTFTGDREDSYDIEQLEQDIYQAPIITGLDETARLWLPLFHSVGPLKNIIFFSTDR